MGLLSLFSPHALHIAVAQNPFAELMNKRTTNRSTGLGEAAGLVGAVGAQEEDEAEPHCRGLGCRVNTLRLYLESRGIC